MDLFYLLYVTFIINKSALDVKKMNFALFRWNPGS